MISVQIEYQTQYNQALFISGNTEILGYWNAKQAVQMKWTEVALFINILNYYQGNIWKVSIPVTITRFEYKYFVAEFNNPNQELLWERGPNRVYKNAKNNCKQLSQFSKDIWEHRIVRFQYYKNNETQVSIRGSSGTVSSFQKNQPMEYVKDYFATEILVNLNQNKEIYFYFDIVNNGGFTRRTNMQRANISLIQNNKYRKNIMIIKINRKKRSIQELDQKIYYGQIPKTKKDFDQIEIQEVQAIVQFVQDANKSVVPLNSKYGKMAYIQINILALRLRFGQQFKQCLINLFVELKSRYKSFFLCNESVKYLKDFLHKYQDMCEILKVIPLSHMNSSHSFNSLFSINNLNQDM